MKRLWISVKRGFITDPKHRVAVGECVWLFEYMLDIADWDTGIIHDWKDEAIAEEMAMPVRTLREQRRKLEELDYVVCVQKQHTQDIAINNWTNPRDYTGEVLNKKQGGNRTSPSISQGDTQGSSQDVTPTFKPKNQTKEYVLTEKDKKEANELVTAMIDNARKNIYQNRDKIPEAYLEYCDLYVKLTGQEPRKSVIQDWLMEFSEWQSAGITKQNLIDAFEKSKNNWLVTRPGGLTKTAIALMGSKRAVNVVDESVRVVWQQEIHYAGED